MIDNVELPHLRSVLNLVAQIDPTAGGQVADGLQMAAESGWRQGIRPLRAMVAAGLDLQTIEQAVWATRGFEYLGELPEIVAPELFEVLPPQDCLDIGAYPVSLRREKVVVAVVDPTDRTVLGEIRSRFAGLTLDVVVTNRDALEAAVSNLEDAAVTDDYHDDEALTRAAWLASTEDQVVASGRIADLADLLIERAFLSGASDIHIEPDGDRCSVRFRLDGVLTPAGNHPGSFTQTLVNRIKILSQLDVGDRRLPQDGRASAIYGGQTVDLRVVTIPSAWGTESCVIRLLHQTRVQPRLASLGFSRHAGSRLEQLLSLSGGVVLATGPTGSGKTTTLYSALQRLTTDEVKTITVEDPVEYRMPGMLQVQVNRAMGFDFAMALRAILRADPDVLLVGEVRDGETAKTAIGAALTGQVVMASLHAATAASAPVRLIDLGVEPFMVGAALRGVVNQRLLRRLCRRCRLPYAPRRSQLDDAGWTATRPDRLWGARPGGCEVCFGTGYRGRTVVAEVMIIDDVLRTAIIEHAEPAKIEALAVERAMVPIRQDALHLARHGATSLEEIARVLGQGAD